MSRAKQSLTMKWKHSLSHFDFARIFGRVWVSQKLFRDVLGFSRTTVFRGEMTRTRLSWPEGDGNSKSMAAVQHLWTHSTLNLEVMDYSRWRPPPVPLLSNKKSNATVWTNWKQLLPCLVNFKCSLLVLWWRRNVLGTPLIPIKPYFKMHSLPWVVLLAMCTPFNGHFTTVVMHHAVNNVSQVHLISIWFHHWVQGTPMASIATRSQSDKASLLVVLQEIHSMNKQPSNLQQMCNAITSARTK